MSAFSLPRVRWGVAVPTPSVQPMLVAGLLAGVIWAIWTMPETLSLEGRKVLIVTLAAIVGWVGTRLSDSIVAIGAALALVLWGAIPEDRLFATLGSELVWLLLAAFVIAAILKESGLVARVMAPVLGRGPCVLSLFAFLTLAIAGTAFLLPSTSARAALMLPVYAALLPLLPDPRIGRALALLFPSVILLSAGSSLIGAGAHVVAVEAVDGATGLRLGYMDWVLLGAPLGFLASAVAAGLILWLFVPRALWRARLGATTLSSVRDPRQGRILSVLICLIALWVSEPLHGLSIALVALLGALVLLTPAFIDKRTKDVFRAVDTELLVYLAATMLIAQAMTASGADRWMAAGALEVLPEAVATNATGIAVALSLVAVGAHLAITSRSARAAVLIPAVALPVAGLGHDAALTVLIVTMGTGFCQTMMASAKPVAIYGNHDAGGFTQADLFRLAFFLAPIKILLLIAFASWIWPGQLNQLRMSPEPVFSAHAAVSATASATIVPASVTSESSRALAISLRPSPRPEPAIVPARARVSANPRGPERATTQRPAFEQKLRQAQRQIARDFKAARTQFRRDFKKLF
ncbi:MAG: sodium/sulfate symporter [Rhodobacteraceae bacterium]|nr:sodium/sulfate symporter [Paracoccaceae bacterium]